jgi:tRNA pseudouridine55 synthase
VNGVLVIDKPAGPTSHDVVARVRRAAGVRRIGHTGTLDPLASGVLPLVVGPATRLARFFSGADKAYDAWLRLGVATDTYDALGEVTARTPVPPGGFADRSGVERVLENFRGAFLQPPPPFSAKKVAGVRAYALARAAREVLLPPVPVVTRELTLLRLEPARLQLRIVCSAGFYVRALAQAIGALLGCGAHLEALRRTRSGEFDLSAAVPLEQAEEAGPAVAERLVPTSALLSGLPGVRLTERGLQRVTHGSPLGAADLAVMPDAEALRMAGPDRPFRLLDGSGRLVALGAPGSGAILHPIVVLG